MQRPAVTYVAQLCRVAPRVGLATERLNASRLQRFSRSLVLFLSRSFRLFVFFAELSSKAPADWRDRRRRRPHLPPD